MTRIRPLEFWREQPALFYALFVLIGAGFSLYPRPVYLLPLCLIIISSQNIPKIRNGIVLLLLTYIYTGASFTFPQISDEKVKGRGILTIESVDTAVSHFGKSYTYTGMLKEFTTQQGEIWHNIPCKFYSNAKKAKLPVSRALTIEGSLQKKGLCRYTLKDLSYKEEKNPSSHFSGSKELKFALKKNFLSYLKKQIPSTKVYAFLSSLMTGSLEEKALSLEFNKTGLQHLLSVSGFQFVLIVTILGSIFHRLLNYKLVAILTLTILGAYFFLLGGSPAIQRAWIALSLFFIAYLFNLKITPLNSLGVALAYAVLSFPPIILNLGFQLSFLCTFAILTLYPLIRRVLATLLPIREKQHIQKMQILDRGGSFLSYLCRETLAINLAVHIFSIPVLLFYFHKFPLISLAYNLFFPFGASFVFVLALAALSLGVFSQVLAGFLFKVCTICAKTLLIATSYPPPFLNFSIRVEGFSFEMCILAVSLIATATVLLKEPQKKTGIFLDVKKRWKRLKSHFFN